jgi:hypothetical protein
MADLYYGRNGHSGNYTGTIQFWPGSSTKRASQPLALGFLLCTLGGMLQPLSFGFCVQRESPALQGRKWLRGEAYGSLDQGMALWLMPNEIWKSKTEILIEEIRTWDGDSPDLL